MTENTGFDFAAATGLEVLRHLESTQNGQPNIGKLLGLSIDSLDEGRVVMSLEPRALFANQLGTMHGGISATLLDSVMGCAVHSSLPPATSYTTLELKVNYIRPVPIAGGRLTGIGNVVHLGRRSATAEGKITNADGKLVAHATTTCMVFPSSV
ncbi:thioesterase [Rhodococcus sp. WMMA185]|uniref:PaaI family thioesterase n=1 Tax=Rhodococcus sp. WMMA185 TaxID=679318 RepID=UPI000878FD2C|nr:PaaI family thioesterase [Rhodococcus sp. WMMA185]AOW93715.1 thioesterase [Rhodococcus sp. WMMA185]